jgi:hypothetical protein
MAIITSNIKKFARKGYGITFVDLDETLFHTFAKIYVVKNGLIVKKLSNSEFNNYVLNFGESFDFSEFTDAKLFKETSIPITPTLLRIKNMIKKIKENKSFSRIILLTARSDFKDKELFLKAFSEQGIDVTDKDIFYIERSGNIKQGTIAEKKQNIIIKYLKTGIYRKCRMIDDDMTNLRHFLELEKTISKEILSKTRETYSLKDTDKALFFYALHIGKDGKLKKIN